MGKHIRSPVYPVEAQNLPLTRTRDPASTQVVRKDTGIPVLADSTLRRIYRQGEVLDVDSVDDRIVKNRIPVILDRELLV